MCLNSIAIYLHAPKIKIIFVIYYSLLVHVTY